MLTPFARFPRRLLPALALAASLLPLVTAVRAQPTSLAVTTLAGSAGNRQATNGTGSAARFYAPSGLVLDASGNLIVVDACNNILRKVTAAGVVTTFSGLPIDLESRPTNTGSADGGAATASFNVGSSSSAGGPWGPPIYTIVGSVTAGTDRAGNIYLADTLNNTIRRVSADGSVTTIAGAPGADGYTDGTAAAARFLSPNGVCVDSAGNVHVADSGNNLIRRITPAGVVTTLAGLARAAGSRDGAGGEARFNDPSGLAIDANGILYVADSGNSTIRRISPAGVVTTLAGRAGSSGASDGNGLQARFNRPRSLAVDVAGNLYVADTGNHSIRVVSPDGDVRTVAGGTGASGSADGSGNAARFLEPAGIAVDGAGNVIIADTGNNTIRRASAAVSTTTLQIVTQPLRRYVNPGRSVTFTASATSSAPLTYQWFKNGTALGGATNSSFTLSSVAFADAAIYTVAVSSGTLTVTSAQAELSVFPASVAIPAVLIVNQPVDATVPLGRSATFIVEVAAEPSVTYQWRKDGTPIPGATSASYVIASVTAGSAGQYSVVTSDAGVTVTSTSASLTVDTSVSANVAPVITTAPTARTAAAGATVSFTAAATGTPTPALLWRRNGAPLTDGPTPGGATLAGTTTATLTLQGVTAADAGNYTVTATNAAGSVTSSAATLTVNAAPASGRIVNLSILTGITAPGDSFKMGYVVGGTGTSGSKPLVIRAAGPSLGALGVTGTLDDPKLELYAGETKTGENDNWGGDATVAAGMSAVGAFPFTGPASRDAAVVTSITTRDNSVKVSAAGNGTGTVIAEVYDATPAASFSNATPRLLNVSVLKHIGTSLTAGFVIGGSAAKTVLIRAIGPTLNTAFGVGGVVGDPRLVLFGANQNELGQNDNWGGTAALKAAFTAVGAFPLADTSLDAALVVTLNPGNYSVVVSGVGGTGQALVEVYDVP